MRTEHYTHDTVCRSIGMAGFETDPELATAGESIRLLLLPSFHPEVCITLRSGAEKAVVSVVAAQAMVWHLPNPARVPTDRAQGEVSMECFARFVAALAATHSGQEEAGVVLDGMPVHALLVRQGHSVFKVRRNVGTPSALSACVAEVISSTWGSLQSVPCRNALAHAAEYSGLDLPLAPDAAQKPTIKTMVLGEEEDRQELLDALKRQHGG